MIEFKAECGHTVRAKDEDAGGTVRCSYCGRPADVPENKSDELDFLFSDIKEGGDPTAPAVRGGPQRASRVFRRRARRRGEFDPFAVVLRLCYAALLISIVIFVGRKWVLPLVKYGVKDSVTGAAATPAPAKPQRGEPRVDPQAPPRPGLISREQLAGLYIRSTPPGATAYCLDAARAPADGRINAVQGCQQFQPNESVPHVGDGLYLVEVAFAINDRDLTNYVGYMSFRRSLEDAPPEQRRQLVEDYFIPDEASTVLVDQTPEQIYLVRQYRDVEVRNKRSAGVRALFLPRIRAAQGPGFSLEELVANYIPKQITYNFDEQHVLSELRYYNVRSTDEPFALQALLRIGIIPCVTSDGRTRIFKIGIEDGAFATRVVLPAKP